MKHNFSTQNFRTNLSVQRIMTKNMNANIISEFIKKLGFTFPDQAYFYSQKTNTNSKPANTNSKPATKAYLIEKY